MLPTIQIFGNTITMYGLMIVFGLIAGVSILVLRSKNYFIKTEDALFAAIFGCIGLFIGAKVLFLLLSIPELIQHRKILASNPLLLMKYIMSGYIFYGGLIGALLAIFLYCKRYGINYIRMLDLAAPSIPIIHGFGRIGCLFAGCCYGIPYQGPFQIIFEHSIAAPNHVALLPVQLIESGLNFFVGIVLLIYATPLLKPGRVIGLYIVYYSLLRFIMEYFRGDIVRGFFHGFSTSQWISLFLLPIGIWLIFDQKHINVNKYNEPV